MKVLYAPKQVSISLLIYLFMYIYVLIYRAVSQGFPYSSEYMELQAHFNSQY